MSIISKENYFSFCLMKNESEKENSHLMAIIYIHGKEIVTCEPDSNSGLPM